jgi:uncharacterized protein (TIGR03083 family)
MLQESQVRGVGLAFHNVLVLRYDHAVAPRRSTLYPGDEPMEALEARIALMQAEAERLERYLATLTPAAWRQPSACQGWEVRDVVAHLVEVAQDYRCRIARGVQGEIGPHPEFAPPGTVSDASIAQLAIAYRERLGETLLPTFRAQYAQFSALLAQLGPGDWDKLCYFARAPQSRPVREFLALSVQELAIHGWDIRSRLEPAFHLSPESVTVLVQHTPQLLGRPHRAVFPLPAEFPGPVRFRWELRGAAVDTQDIVAEHGRCRMEPAVASVAQVTFRAEAETFVLLLYQRLPLMVATATGSLMVEGDGELTAAFDCWLQGG